ncbi:hypothetical protein D3C72_1698800 [compost metagenome]
MLGARERHAIQLPLLDRVGQAVAHVVTAIGATGDAAICQEVGAFAAPIVVGDGGVDIQTGTGGVDQAELARTGQVGADHFCQGSAMGVVDGKVGNCDWVLRGARAGNINAQLRVGGLGNHQA